jgi:uncharacterized membrane protein YbaN (DUF454 family)
MILTSQVSEARTGTACRLRQLFLALGCLCVGLGVIGVIVPGMPTTVFMLIALWAFSKSSIRLYRWLWNHPRLGSGIRAWHRYRVIPLRAKLAAVVMMTASLVVVIRYTAEGWLLPVVLAVVMSAVAGWIVTRPSQTTAPVSRMLTPRPS